MNVLVLAQWEWNIWRPMAQPTNATNNSKESASTNYFHGIWHSCCVFESPFVCECWCHELWFVKYIGFRCVCEWVSRKAHRLVQIQVCYVRVARYMVWFHVMGRTSLHAAYTDLKYEITMQDRHFFEVQSPAFIFHLINSKRKNLKLVSTTLIQSISNLASHHFTSLHFRHTRMSTNRLHKVTLFMCLPEAVN